MAGPLLAFLFYSRENSRVEYNSKSVNDIVDHLVVRILDQLDLQAAGPPARTITKTPPALSPHAYVRWV
jgi:hypothetical protein